MCSIFAYGLGFLLVYFYARLRQWLVTFCFEVDGLRWVCLQGMSVGMLGLCVGSECGCIDLVFMVWK